MTLLCYSIKRRWRYGDASKTIYHIPRSRASYGSKLKAVETSRSISGIVDNAFRESLPQDAEVLAAFDERASEPLISYDEMVKGLKEDGRI